MMRDRHLMVGAEIPELVKHPTLRQLVQYAGTSGDFYEIHYDPAAARANSHPGVILHGLLKAGFLAELVTTWAAPDGNLRDLQVSYRGIDLVGRPIRCRGIISALEGSSVQLDIWTEDPDGHHTTVGHARVEFEGADQDDVLPVQA